jgi:hypothetical protein
MEHVIQPTHFSGDKRSQTKISFWGIPEVWMRFLLAIGGLGLAFASALFSTVSREAGSLWATLVFASLALLLAMFVGLTTVPYLARRVAAGRVRNAFDYEVTRAGFVYFFAVFVIGVAALNTGNNLLYIVLASMLAAILVSAIVSGAVLSGLELDVKLPEHIFAQESAASTIILRNSRRYIPAFSLNVISAAKEKPRKLWRWVPSTFGLPLGRPPEAQWFRLSDWKLKRVSAGQSDAEILQGPVYFPYVAPGATKTIALPMCFSHRGRFHQKGFGLSTRFPFAFLKKTRIISANDEILVYPSVTAAGSLSKIVPRINGEFESFARGRGMELHSIRDSSPEDSSRHVDWKATAKSGSVKVREFTRDDERKLRLVFDNPFRDTLKDDAYESMVQRAAALSWHFAQQNFMLSFAAQNYGGDPDVFSFLAYLAVVAPQTVSSGSVSQSSSGSMLESLPIDSAFNVIVTAQSRTSLPASLVSCSQVIFPDDFLA